MANTLLPRLLPEISANTVQPPVIPQEALPVISTPQVIPERLIKYPLPYNPNYVYVRPKNYLSDYNDPNEINSMADVIAHTLTDGANPFTETWDLFKRTTLDPIRAGQWGVAGINNLINFSETMDIVAAPTKALLQGQGFDGAARALGFGGIDGRQNYDWNTGSLAKDFVYEMLSDPLNWLTLGVKGVVTAGAKKAISEGIEAVSQSAAVTMEKRLYKKLVHQTLDAYYKKDTAEFIKQTEKLITHFEGKGKILFPDSDMKSKAQTIREFSEAIAKADSISKENVGFQINASLNKLSNTVENTERAMLKAALSPVIFPSWWVAKKGFGKAYKMIENRLRKESIPLLRADKTVSFTKWEGILKVVEKANTFEMMQKFKNNPEDVPRHFFMLLQEGARRDILAIGNLFKDHYNDIPKLEEQLTKYMKDYNGVESLQEYAALVDKISQICGNGFAAEAKSFSGFLAKLNELKAGAMKPTKEKIVAGAQELTNSFKLDLEDLFKPPRFDEAEQSLKRQLDELKEYRLDGTFTADDLAREKELKGYWQKLVDRVRTDPRNIEYTLRQEFDRRSKRLGFIDAKKQKGLRARIYRDTVQPYFNYVFEHFQEFVNKYAIRSHLFTEAELKEAFGKWQRAFEKRFNEYIMRSSKLHNGKELAGTFKAPDIYTIFSDVLYRFSGKQDLIQEESEKIVKQEIELDMDKAYLKLLADRTQGKAANKLFDKLVSKLDTGIARGYKAEEKLEVSVKDVEHTKTEIKKLFGILGDESNTLDIGEDFGKPINSTVQMDRAQQYVNDFLLAEPNTAAYEGAHYGLQRYLQGELSRLKGAIIKGRADFATFLIQQTRLHVKNAPYLEEFLKRREKDIRNSVTENGDSSNLILLQRIEDVENVLDMLAKVAPTKVVEATMSLNQFEKLVRVKMESFRTSLELSDKGYIGDLLRKINDVNNPIGNFVQHYAQLDNLTSEELGRLGAEVENLHVACRELYDIAQLNNDYVMFVNSVAAREDINQNMKSAFLASVQNLWHKDPKQFLQSSDAIEELFNSMRIHLLSIKSDDKYNLDYFWTTRNEWGKDLPEEALKDLEETMERHTAFSDAKFTAVLMNTLYPDVFKDIKGINYEDTFIMFGDCETTHTKELLQLALTDRKGHRIWEGTRKMLRATAEDKCPNDEVLAVMYPDVNPFERREAFLTDPRYITNNPEEVVSEYELLSQFLEQLSRSNPSEMPMKNTLVFHNGYGFDYPVIKSRLTAHGLNMKYYEDANRLDSMDLMISQKNPELYVTDTVREVLEQEVSDYALKLYARGSTRLINNRSGDLRAQLGRLDAIFKAGYFPEDSENFAGVLSQVSTELDEVLGQSARNNKAMGYMYISDPFAYITPETREAFIETEAEKVGLTMSQYRERYGYNAEDIFKAASLLDMSVEDVRVVFKDNISLNRILSGKESLAPLTYKNEMIKKLMLSFFNIPETEQLPQKLLTAYYNISKRLSKEVGYVRSPYGIERLRVYVDEALKKVPEYLQDDFFKAMKLDAPDAVTKFIILKYLFNATLYPQWKRAVAQIQKNIRDLQNMKEVNNKFEIFGLEAQLKTMMNGDVPWPDYIPVELKNLLLDPSGIYKATLYGQEVCTDITLSKRMGTSLYTEPELFQEYVAQFQRHNENFTELLNDLSRNLDNKLSNSNVYAVAEANAPMQRILDRMKDMPTNARLKDVAAQHTMYNTMGVQQLSNLLRKTLVDPEYLRSTLVWEAPWIQFGLKQKGEHLLEFKALIEELRKKTADLEALGIKLYEASDRVYLSLDLVKNKIDAEVLKDKFGNNYEVRTFNRMDIAKPVHDEIDMPNLLEEDNMKDFRDIRRRLETLSNGASIGSTGEVLTPSKLKEYYYKLPTDVRSILGDIDDITHKKFWEDLHYDWSNLGTAESKRFANKYGFLTLTELYKNSLHFTSVLAESKALYTELYFDSQYSINNGIMSIEGLSKAEADQVDRDLIEALKTNDEFILAALEVDKNPAGPGYHVVQIKPNTVEDMAYARKMNAVIIPYQVFATSMQSINTTQFSSQVLNLWHKIIYTYKVGYLLDPGVILRNYVDSTGKNLVSADMNVREVAQTQYRAMRLLAKYDRALNDILEHNQHVFNYDNVHTFFDRYNRDPEFTEDQFKYIHGFICYSASAGLTGPWQKYLKEKNFGDIDEHSVWNTFVAMSDKLMGPNKYVEQINRLTQYMLLESKGETQTKIFHEIAKTHFDYNVKTRASMYAELIFPFYTFTMRNLEFWVNGVMEHPWLAGMFKDIMTPIWNFDGLTKDELGRNRSLQYQLLAGNVAINDQGLTLKLNPSYMDVYNILMDMPQAVLALTNPEGVDKVYLGTLESKLAAPLQLAADQLLQTQGAMASGLFDTGINTLSNDKNVWQVIQANLPVFGAIQTRFQLGPKYAERTGQDWQKLPLTQGTFGATQRWDKPKKKIKRSNEATKAYYNTGRNYRYYPSYYNKHWDDYDSFYRKHYTKKGVSKFKLRAMPYTPENLAYRIKDLYWYFR